MELNRKEKKKFRELANLFDFKPLFHWTGISFPKVTDYGNMKIWIYPNEQGHNEPHIHVKRGKNFEASFAIKTGELIVGELPGKKQRKIKNWILENADLLSQEWNEISNGIEIMITRGNDEDGGE